MVAIQNFIKKNIKWLLIGALGIFLVIFLMVTILKYRMPANKTPKVSYHFEQGTLVDPLAIGAEYRTNFEVVAPSDSNKQTKMTIDLETTNVKITQNGKTYETLPYTLRGDNITVQEKSPVTISYFYKGKSTPSPKNAYEGSIEGKNFEVYQLSDGVRVEYEIAERKIQRTWIPEKISSEEYFEIFAQATPEEQTVIRANYSSEGSETSGLIYSLNASVAESHLEILYKMWWDKLGLTLEGLAERAKKLSGTASFIEMPIFKIPVEYRINSDGHFTVEVLTDRIEENGPDLGEKTLRIKSINLLEHMMLIDINTASEDDFLLIPDGSGALIKPALQDQTASYFKSFYNNNQYFKKYSSVVDLSEQITLNSYGISKDGQAMIALVESGAGVGKLNVPSIFSNARVYSDFNLRNDDEYEFVKGVKINQFDQNIIDERIKIKYILLQSSDKVTYYDMALALQEELFKGVAKTKTYSPIEVEMIGAILERKHFVGIPYFKTKALTKYEEALKIVNSLDGLNINYKYSGFSAGGLNGKRQVNQRLDKSLGSSKHFKALNELNNLYFDLYITKKYYNDDGAFRNSKFGLKELGGRPNTYYELNMMTLEKTDNELFRYFMLDPNYLEKEIDKVLTANKNLKNLSFRDLGNTFVTNYTYKPYGFEHASNIISNSLDNLDKAKKIMMSNPFSPFVKYADVIENLPHKSSGHVSFYTDIPFLQLVYAPYINTYSKASNLDGNIDEYYLRALMSQSGLKYILTYNDSSITKTTPYYNQYYATNYLNHLESIKDYYQKLNDFNQENDTIISHNVLDKQVYLVKYSNNNEYVFNLSNRSYTYLGQEILSNNYLKVN